MDNTLSFLISIRCDFQTRINLSLTCKSTLYLLKYRDLWIHNLVRMNCDNLNKFDTKTLIKVHHMLSVQNRYYIGVEDDFLFDKLLLDLGVALYLPLEDSGECIIFNRRMNEHLSHNISDKLFLQRFRENNFTHKEFIKLFQKLNVQDMIMIYRYVSLFPVKTLNRKRITSYNLLTKKVYEIFTNQHIYDGCIVSKALKLSDNEYIYRYITLRGVGSENIRKFIIGSVSTVDVSTILMLYDKELINNNDLLVLSIRVSSKSLAEYILNTPSIDFLSSFKYGVLETSFRYILNSKQKHDIVSMSRIFDIYEEIGFFGRYSWKLFPSDSIIYVEESLKREYHVYDEINANGFKISIDVVELFYKYGRLDGTPTYFSLGCSSSAMNPTFTFLDFIVVVSDINMSRRQILTHCVNKFGIIEQL